MKNFLIALSLVCAVGVGYWIHGLFPAEKKSGAIGVVDSSRMSEDRSGFVPLFAEGEAREGDVRVFVSPSYVEIGGYKTDHRSVIALANRVLKEEKAEHLAVVAAQETPYFQVIQVLDDLRHSNAVLIRLITKEPNQAPEPMPLKRHGSS